jgi:hypothetical protein
MDPEHHDLREACRRVSQQHIESVTPEDIEKVRQLMTPGDMQAVMFTMADRYKFGDVVAYCQPQTLTKAIQLAIQNYNDKKSWDARRVVKRNKLLQCGIFENIDEDIHKECVSSLLAAGQEIGDPTAQRDGKVKALPTGGNNNLMLSEKMADHVSAAERWKQKQESKPVPSVSIQVDPETAGMKARVVQQQQQ